MPQIYHKTAIVPNPPKNWVVKKGPRLKKGSFKVANAILEELPAMDSCAERLLFFMLAQADGRQGQATVPIQLVDNQHARVVAAIALLRTYAVKGKPFFKSIEWSYGRCLRWQFTLAGIELMTSDRCFTVVRYPEYMKLRRKRGRLLYLYLAQFASTGVVKTTLAKWQQRLQAVADTYERRPAQFIRCVLGPATASVKLNTRFKHVQWQREGQVLTLNFTQVLSIPAGAEVQTISKPPCTCASRRTCICTARLRAHAALRELGVTKDMAQLMAYAASYGDFATIQRLTYRVANDEVLRGRRRLPISNKGAYLIRAGQNILFGTAKSKVKIGGLVCADKTANKQRGPWR